MATILKAFRFALEPTQAQDATLRAWVPSLRFLWNHRAMQKPSANLNTKLVGLAGKCG
jgi:Helix-turn-helix domain